MKTTKLSKVLIALDYDPTARKVADAGYLLAKSMEAEVVLLHIISEPVYYHSPDYSPIMGFTGTMDLGPLQIDDINDLKKVSFHFLNKYRDHLGDKAIKTVVEEGDFAETIIKTAKHLHADVIVVGSHSHKWFENILMGSVTEQVLQHSTLPLYIVPTKKQK